MNVPYNQKDFNRILNRYVAGKANEEEIRFIEAYYKYLEKEENILDNAKQEELRALGEASFQSILAKTALLDRHKKQVHFYRYIAAAVLLIASISSLWYFSNEQEIIDKKIVATQKKIDVLPGVDKAILTLSDGSQVVLDNAENKKIVEKEGLTISKTTDGQLLYQVSNSLPKATTIAYNTIATSKGNQYQLVLADGTKVWLNAASSLKYPEFFTGNERKVILSGEAYFEVAKNKNMPFTVVCRNQVIKVLGTHFNVNSYLDDSVIKTTLVEGSVQVANAYHTEILNPGEQALVFGNATKNISILKGIDIDAETAWKNGSFSFNNAKLKTILNQLERWYDVKIDYQSVPDKRYHGMVSRKSKLSEVLKMLELTGNISFKIEEGNHLKVSSKL